MTGLRRSSIFNLRFSISTALLIFFLLHSTAANSAAQAGYTVKWVTDGDTIVLSTGQRIRYIGINAPEIDHEGQKAQPFAYEARSFNKDLVMSQQIILRFDAERYDQYGRTLAYIFRQDGEFVNARLVQEGYAFCLYRPPNVFYDKILLQAQRAAMASKAGLWRHWQEEKKRYIGNQISRRFHLPTCPLVQKIKSTHRITFSSKWDAFQAGYAPAKTCINTFWSYAGGD
jgi:micrococcal nuclease